MAEVVDVRAAGAGRQRGGGGPAARGLRGERHAGAQPDLVPRLGQDDAARGDRAGARRAPAPRGDRGRHRHRARRRPPARARHPGAPDPHRRRLPPRRAPGAAGRSTRRTSPSFDILFIENVGNLICPTSYDLGEDFKVALLSVTEGDDKPFKYPAIFARAEVTVITKADLLPHVSFDLEAVREQVATLNPAGTLAPHLGAHRRGDRRVVRAARGAPGGQAQAMA